MYNPHDLQHLHYPQFFPARDHRVARDGFSGRLPLRAHRRGRLAVGEGRRDQALPVHPDKVQVIFEAPTTESQSEPSEDALAAVRKKYQIDAAVRAVPGHDLAHKNHIRLLEALAHLRDTKGLVVPLICTGP